MYLPGSIKNNIYAEGKKRREDDMDGDYVFLCGVMWCRYGQQDAGNELLRAAASSDPDLSTLALAMLVEGCKSLQRYPNAGRSLDLAAAG
jgi:hypothetical protein